MSVGERKKKLITLCLGIQSKKRCGRRREKKKRKRKKKEEQKKTPHTSH